MANSTKDYYLTLRSNHPFFNFEKSDELARIETIYVGDSIFDFYPNSELYIRDTKGIITEGSYFQEGLELSLRWGDRSGNFLDHLFYWENSQLLLGRLGEHLAGSFLVNLQSLPKYQDSIKSRVFQNNIAGKDFSSSIVHQILRPYKFSGFPEPLRSENQIISKIKVSITDNYDIWGQFNESDEQFLKKLATYSISKNQLSGGVSPYFAFWNLKGEFYFYDIWSLFQHPSKATYRLRNDESAQLDKYIIQNYSLLFPGSTFNMPNYNRFISYRDSKGAVISKNFTLKEKLVNYEPRRNTSKLGIPIHRNLMDSLGIKSKDNFGNVESDSDLKSYNGWVNSLFKDSTTMFRFEIDTEFNPELAAGDIVTLELKSSFSDKLNCVEYSGKWLVAESNHRWDIEEATNRPYSRFLLVRPAIQIHESHRFFKEFLSNQ